MRKSEADRILRASDALIDEASKVFAMHPPDEVGVALGELVAIFIASHHPSLRKQQRRVFFDLVDDLVPTIVNEQIEAGVVGPEWRMQ